MSDLKLIVRTADRTKKAEVTLTPQQTGGDVIQSAVENWALPRDTDFEMMVEVVLGAACTIFAPASWCWPGPAIASDSTSPCA